MVRRWRAWRRRMGARPRAEGGKVGMHTERIHTLSADKPTPRAAPRASVSIASFWNQWGPHNYSSGVSQSLKRHLFCFTSPRSASDS